MALPTHLAHFDSLLDLLADGIVRELEREVETQTPGASPALADDDQRERSDDGDPTTTPGGAAMRTLPQAVHSK